MLRTPLRSFLARAFPLPELSGRTWKVTIGSLDVTQLDLTFDIIKTSTREPNTAEVRVFNLSPGNKSTISAEEDPRLLVRAGYGDPPPLLFLGNSRRLFTERKGTDLITTVQASDSGSALQIVRLSRSYNEGTPVLSVVRDSVNALGIGEGNLSDFESAYTARNGTDNFPDGYTTDGPARNVLNSLIRAAGLRWSVQDGVLQIQRPGTPLQTQAVLLSPSTGLVGSPTRGAAESCKRPNVSAQALIQPEFYPGRRVVLQSSIEGTYEILKIKYVGNTRGQDWYANLELRPLT